MSPPTWEDTPHLGAGSRYRPTPAGDDRADRPPATAPPAQEQQWTPAPNPGDLPPPAPPPPTAPFGLAGPSTNAMATAPEVLTAREAAAILRVGRNQLYQAVARGQLGAIRIGRIRIPTPSLSSSSPAAVARQPASQVRQGPP